MVTLHARTDLDSEYDMCADASGLKRTHENLQIFRSAAQQLKQVIRTSISEMKTGIAATSEAEEESVRSRVGASSPSAGKAKKARRCAAHAVDASFSKTIKTSHHICNKMKFESTRQPSTTHRQSTKLTSTIPRQSSTIARQSSTIHTTIPRESSAQANLAL